MPDVAALAGVSLSTVSRVVNGEGAVRADLAERVRDAIDMLGYRRDLTASNLRRADRASASVGLLVEDGSNPFFSQLHRGVEEVARTRGVLTSVGSSDEENAQTVRQERPSRSSVGDRRGCSREAQVRRPSGMTLASSGASGSLNSERGSGPQRKSAPAR